MKRRHRKSECPVHFALEVFGAAPVSPLVVLIGANPNFQPFDLGVIGITGCTLYVDVAVDLAAMTSAGDAPRGEGTATIGAPIPNDPGIRGFAIEAQVGIVDVNSGRGTPITMTNALSITIQ